MRQRITFGVSINAGTGASSKVSMEFKVVNYLKQKGMCRAYPFSLYLRMVYISSQTRG